MRRNVTYFLAIFMAAWWLPDSTASIASPPSSDGAVGPADGERPAGDGKKNPKRRMPRGLAYKALRMEIDNARFDGMTLEEFTEWINRTTKANVVVKWKLLEAEGIEPDAEIHLKLTKVKLRKVLQLAFQQITEDLDGVELAAKADNNTLVISTKKDLFDEMVTRTYDVRHLLVTIPMFTERRLNDPAFGRGYALGGGVGRPGEFGDASQEDQVRRLVDMITTHIEPETWQVNGGKGTIAYFQGMLVVRNNLEVQRRIGGVKPKQKDAADRNQDD
jgi:hypothetical protein